MIVTKSGVMDDEFWDLFEAEKVTCFHAVPTTYDMLHHIGIFEEVFPDLKTMSQAGGKLSTALQEYYAQYAKKNGKRFIKIAGHRISLGSIIKMYCRRNFSCYISLF